MEKKISKKTLSKSFHHWYYGNLTCFSQEHMQTFGYLTSMLPIIEELYDKKEDQAKALKTYTAFFNTEPQLGTVIVGVTAGLEEARANGADDVDDETINGLRAGLMGPIAGIGDSLVEYCYSNLIRYRFRYEYWRFSSWCYLLYDCMELIRILRNEVLILQRL